MTQKGNTLPKGDMPNLQVIQMRSGWQVRWNFQEVTRTDMDEETTSWDYDYMNIQEYSEIPDEVLVEVLTELGASNSVIESEINSRAVKIEQKVKQEEMEKLADEKVVELRESIALLGDEQALDVKSKYKPYKVPMTLTVGDRFYYPLNDKLYKVIGPEGTEHITQLNWKPTTAVSIYAEVTPPGVIAPWVQPLGAHNVYNTGDRVTHNEFTWESTADNNTWEPGVYGWVKV